MGKEEKGTGGEMKKGGDEKGERKGMIRGQRGDTPRFLSGLTPMVGMRLVAYCW